MEPPVVLPALRPKCQECKEPIMATLPTSPAFNPPTPSLEPDESIVRVNLGVVEIGARMSQQPKDIKNAFPVTHIPNGK